MAAFWHPSLFSSKGRANTSLKHATSSLAKCLRKSLFLSRFSLFRRVAISCSNSLRTSSIFLGLVRQDVCQTSTSAARRIFLLSPSSTFRPPLTSKLHSVVGRSFRNFSTFFSPRSVGPPTPPADASVARPMPASTAHSQAHLNFSCMEFSPLVLCQF